MNIVLKAEDESFLEEEKHQRVLKEIQELFEREDILDALVHHFKVSQEKACTTRFHAELEDGFGRITVTDPELTLVLVEILDKDDWLDSINREKTTADIGKWTE